MSEKPSLLRRWRAGVLTGVVTMGLGVGAVVVTQQANAATIDTSAFYVLKNRNSGKALEVFTQSTADGAKVTQWAVNNGAWQQFKFLDMGSGFYRLQAKHSGKVVNVRSASKSDGAAVVQSTGDKNATSQQWTVQDISSGYVRLINRNSSKVLNITGSSTADGAAAVTSTGSTSANSQQWQLVKVGASSGGGTTTPATPATPSTPTAAWPSATSTKPVSSTIPVSGTLDGKNVRYVGSGALGGSGQDEGQDPLFKLADGAVLKNVILGAPAADGIHCSGSCTLQNVWWENVGEDAATFKGGASAKYIVDGGGARSADDKVFQHNGGGTLTIKNFQVADFGKLYRSCGNCSTQHKRAVVVQNVVATAPAGSLVGINQNFGDTATLSAITVVGKKSLDICVRFTGNNTGKEPTKVGTGPDGTFCKYSTSSITFK
ncbi:pectate lyase [Actinoplanes sp. G11-F43]|uniref:pectate lyase n=1 Tax=Actinoplanes sp. G11-F43 TaxID=3424130 RepID=UPI003D34C0B7